MPGSILAGWQGPLSGDGNWCAAPRGLEQMKKNFGNTLRVILQDTLRETELARLKESFKRVKQMAKDAPPVLPFKVPLACGAALIAQIKDKSPSHCAILLENVRQALSAYKHSL